MHYSAIKEVSIENGPGVRVSLFVSGCRNHCKGCFQPETWDFDYGEEFTDETLGRILNLLAPRHIRGLSILGGDPMEYLNQSKVLEICQRVKETFLNKDIWLYTGYMYESFMSKVAGENQYSPILSYIDVMIDGPFVEHLKDLSLRYRGSSNQRIIDVQKSLSSGAVALWEDPANVYAIKKFYQ